MRSLMRCVVVLGLLLLPRAAWGQRYVLSVPTDQYPTVQSALNEAGSLVAGALPGDVLIEVSPGTYSEALLLDGVVSPTFRVTLRATGGQSVTTIDASSSGRPAFRGQGVQNFTLDGFTVRNRYDPLVTCCPRGMNLFDSTRITVQNCFFDTTAQAMFFNVLDPDFSSEVTVVHNTAVGGNGTDPEADDYVGGQAVNMVFQPLEEGAAPTGDHRLLVADNVFRTRGSAVRYLMSRTDSWGVTLEVFTNGTLIMTGNDTSTTAAGCAYNVFGGRGHFISRNRFHDGICGGQITGMTGGVIENNLFVRNGHGLLIWEWSLDEIPLQKLTVRHNTVVNNLGVGIVYGSDREGPIESVASVYSNIVAFNDGSGIATVRTSALGGSAFAPIDLHLAKNDVYGNTLRGLMTPNYMFSFEEVSNPEAATDDYAPGALEAGLDLSVNPTFVSAQGGDFSLKKNSKLVDAGLASRPFPSFDFAGTFRDAAPDIGAFEIGATVGPRNPRENPNRQGPKPSTK